MKRFEDFEDASIRRGLIGKKDFIFHKIKTKETPEEKDYEKSVMRKILHNYKIATMGRYKSGEGGIKYQKENNDFFMNFVRKIFS